MARKKNRALVLIVWQAGDWFSAFAALRVFPAAPIVPIIITDNILEIEIAAVLALERSAPGDFAKPIKRARLTVDERKCLLVG
jgi:hypothetical protein